MNAPQVKVRMDRGRDFSTVHGERAPGNRYANVYFFQDGLPFDSHGFLIADHPDLQGDSPEAKKLRDRAERKLKEAARRRSNAPDPDDDPEHDGEGDDGEERTVNLEAWLRGEEDCMWHILTQTIAQRFKRRVNNLPDAVTFLVEQNVVPANQVAKKYQKHLEAV